MTDDKIVVKQTSPLLSDSRGLFFEVANNTEIRHIIITTFIKGAVRGNQFRRNMDQYFFLASGKAKLITQMPDGSSRTETPLVQGSLVYIPRGMAFVTVAEEESILLEFSPQAYDPSNPDINRCKIV